MVQGQKPQMAALTQCLALSAVTGAVRAAGRDS